MSHAVEEEIRALRAHFWSSRDPEGRAFVPLADAYRRKGELDEARSLVEDGLARLPGFSPGHLVAARIHRARGELDEARASLDRVLGLDGDNVLALLERAELARDTGDREGASRDLRTLLALDPNHMGAKAALGRLEDGGSGAEPTPVAAEAGLEPGVADPDPDPDEPPVAPATDEGPFRAEELIDADELFLGEPPEEDPDAAGAFDGSAPEGTAPDEAAPAAAESPAPDSGELDVFEFDADLGLTPADAGDPDGFPDASTAARASEPDADESGPRLVTRTLAELFERQGLADRAIWTYRRLLERDPDDAELRARLDELVARTEADVDEPEPSEVAPQWVDDLRDGDEAGIATPFAWDGEGDEEPATHLSPGGIPRSIRDHFEDLLSWVPGAVPIEALAPGAAGPSPAELRQADAAARSAAAVPIEDLAPGAPLETAPEGSPAALRAAASRSQAVDAEPDTAPGGAPRDAADHAEAPPEDDLDDFQAWLESLRP